jgi:hypothetical protein
MRASTPHECVAIHSYSFLSEEFVSTCRVPGYEAFLRQVDLRPAYTFQKRFLQHLQFRCPLRRWVLKAPDHVNGLEELFAAFPDALIIQTHRNPLEVLKSSCQLSQVLQGLYARPAKPQQLAARELRVLAESVDRLTKFRDDHPEIARRFVDVKYTELVSDPLGVIGRVYKTFELPLTEKAVERMRSLAGKRSRYRRREKNGTPAALNPQVTAHSHRFDQYCARFGIGRTRADS